MVHGQTQQKEITMTDIKLLVKELGNLNMLEAKDLCDRVQQGASVPDKINILAEQIIELTAEQSIEYRQTCQEDWGITADVDVVATAEASVEAKSTASVMITGFEAGKKIAVLKKVKQILELGLLEAKNFVEDLPKTVKEDLDKSEAEEMKKALEDAGATVQLK
jgi:large subunit ribosomal protein L7/L12|tara:strand:+ start:259 stop:750 length:492 start_codon:yes stop_codon:yes gene_type:complete